MLSFSSKDRCKKCHNERALRQCARSGKGICWRCCNSWRMDEKCPSECPYSAKSSAENPIPAFRADNSAEFQDIYRRYIDLWIGRANTLTAGKSPLHYAMEDKNAMLGVLGKFLFPDAFPMEYLMQKLQLPFTGKALVENPEDAAIRYLERFIARDFDGLADLSFNFLASDTQKQNYNQYMQELAYLKKLKNISPIHTASNYEERQSMVFVELNYKVEWCMILHLHDNKWYIAQNINGNPAKYYQQNNVYQNIAHILQARNMQQAEYEIAEALRTYVDSADLYNLRAMCQNLNQDAKRAEKDLLTAISLDASFVVPYVNYCILLLNNNKVDEAESFILTALKYDSENPDVLNMHAVIFAMRGELETARNIWRQILEKHPDYENAQKNLAQR